MRLDDVVRKLCTTSFFLVSAASAAVLVYLFYYHFTLVTFPWPIQYREGAILLSTDLLLKGGNPYSMALQPYYCNAYGLFYNFCVLPFVWLFGASLITHKAIAGISTLMALILMLITMKRFSLKISCYLPAVVFTYSCLLYNKTSLAEPDSTGVFIYLLSALIPLLFNFSTRSLIASAFFVGLAFLTKPYFIVGCAVVLTHLLLSKSYRKLATYLATLTGIALVEVFILNHFFETYIINVLLSNYNYGKITSEGSWPFKQLWYMITQDPFYVFTIVLVSGLCLFYSTTSTKNSLPGKYAAQASILQLALFLLFLGKNTGAWATYFYQLALPFIALFVAVKSDQISNKSAILCINIAMMIAVLWTIRHYPPLSQNFTESEAQWQRAKSLIATHTNILNSPAIAPLLLEMNKPVYDSGQTAMFKFGIENPKQVSSRTLQNALAMEQQFHATIHNNITLKKFDLIMTDREFSHWLLPPGSLMQYYNYKGQLTLDMPHTNYQWQIDLWEPKQDR